VKTFCKEFFIISSGICTHGFVMSSIVILLPASIISYRMNPSIQSFRVLQAIFACCDYGLASFAALLVVKETANHTATTHTAGTCVTSRL
jgi:hypothetical protein